MITAVRSPTGMLLDGVGGVELNPVHGLQADPHGRERVGTQQTGHRSMFSPVACPCLTNFLRFSFQVFDYEAV